jgi:hypothetical protein
MRSRTLVAILAAVSQATALTLSTACAIGPSAVNALCAGGVTLIRLDAPLAMGQDDATPPAAVLATAPRAWVHAGTTIKELAAAKRAGAATVWLNAAAATATEGGLEDMGYLGASIVDDFADSTCGSADELAVAARTAWRAFEDKLELQDARGERERARGKAVEDVEVLELTDWTPPPSDTPKSPAARQHRFCIMCGAKLPAVARYCSECGEPQVTA